MTSPRGQKGTSVGKQLSQDAHIQLPKQFFPFFCHPKKPWAPDTPSNPILCPLEAIPFVLSLGIPQHSCCQSSHQAFHSGGSGVTRHSLASHSSSDSVSGSIPIIGANSRISGETEEGSVKSVYTTEPPPSAKAVGTLGNPEPKARLPKATSTVPCARRAHPARLGTWGVTLPSDIQLCLL